MLMPDGCNVHKEGELYTTVSCYGYSFELRYGYYEETDRATGEPVIIYPDLQNNRFFDDRGNPLVTAIQSSCEFYEATDKTQPEECCSDCIFYSDSKNEIDVCLCPERNNNKFEI